MITAQKIADAIAILRQLPEAAALADLPVGDELLAMIGEQLSTSPNRLTLCGVVVDLIPTRS